MESSTTPLYNRKFAIGLDSTAGSSNVEGYTLISFLVTYLSIYLVHCLENYLSFILPEALRLLMMILHVASTVAHTVIQ